MLKAKGLVLLKYLVVLVVAGVVGYLAGHWGADRPGAPQQTTDAALEIRVKKLESRMKNLDGWSGLYSNLKDRIRELEYQQSQEPNRMFP